MIIVTAAEAWLGGTLIIHHPSLSLTVLRVRHGLTLTGLGDWLGMPGRFTDDGHPWMAMEGG